MRKKATNADNQQGSPSTASRSDPSETTRRSPLFKRIIKAYFLGALHDGTFSSNHRFRISQKGTAWLIILRKLLKEIEYNSWIYKEGATRDVYVHETLASFLDFRFNPLALKASGEKIAYVRGFFDAEGGITHRRKAPFYIQLVQKNKQKLELLKRLLIEVRIQVGEIHNPSVRVDPEYWRMFVLAGSRQRFIRLIGSWHPRKILILNKRMVI